ncbi:MAG: GNAT family N-acetyltransferase [Sphingomonadales bacterium]|nr:GNAT family N-acetyltransferase [Sphingomonadales bacterium]
MSLIRLTGRLIGTAPEHRRVVLTHLPGHIRETVREPGCLFFDIAQTDDPLVWTVSEGFASRAAFDAHQARTAASDWGAATRGIGRDYRVEEAPPEILPETPDDARAIDLLTRAAFGAPEEADLIAALRASGDLALSLVARFGRAYLGHVGFSRVAAPVPAWALAPVSVREAVRGQGIAARLIRDGIALARERGIKAIFVLGDPAYYARFGFSVAEARDFASPYAGAYWQVLNLSGAALPGGKVTHAAPFAALD